MEYADSNRGIIQNRQRARQIIDFSGLQYGKITPTDLDGLIEYQNKAFIFYEFKFGNADLPYGQKLALERLANRIKDVEVAVLVCEHNTEDPNEDINAGNAIVRNIFYRGKWYSEKRRRSVKQVTDAFIQKCTE